MGDGPRRPRATTPRNFVRKWSAWKSEPAKQPPDSGEKSRSRRPPSPETPAAGRPRRKVGRRIWKTRASRRSGGSPPAFGRTRAGRRRRPGGGAAATPRGPTHEASTETRGWSGRPRRRSSGAAASDAVDRAATPPRKPKPRAEKSARYSSSPDSSSDSSPASALEFRSSITCWFSSSIPFICAM